MFDPLQFSFFAAFRKTSCWLGAVIGFGVAAAYRHDVAGSQFRLDLSVGSQDRLQFFTQNFDLNCAVEAEESRIDWKGCADKWE